MKTQSGQSANSENQTIRHQLDQIWTVRVPGKWILAGEHAVLRGCPAIVFPLHKQFLELQYEKSDRKFSIEIAGQSKSDLEIIIWSVLEKAFNEITEKNLALAPNLTLSGQVFDRSSLCGVLKINSHIQFGTGVGASATLAVGLTLFLEHLGLLQVTKQELFLFAKKLEDLFHGESSGVDVAIALEQQPILYRRGQPIQLLSHFKLPRLYLSYTGSRGVTKDCVDKVKSMFVSDHDQAEQIDQQMKNVVNHFIEHDFSWNLETACFQLSRAQQCFVDWGLVPDSVLKHIADLKKYGAQECKVTGSGQGGYVISVWNQPPSELAQKSLNLIEVHAGSTDF